MTLLTVGLPLFNTKYIAWLALESMVRQKVDFDWELIIAEEQNEFSIDKKELEQYFNRLKENHCTRIEYIPLDKWVYLSEKWKMITAKASADSIAFLPCGGDNYLQPDLFNETLEIIDSGADWTYCKRGLWYDIKTGKNYLYEHDLLPKSHIGLSFGIRTSLVRKLIPMNKMSGNDNWLFKQCTINKGKEPLNVSINSFDSWKGSLFTRGLNSISNPERQFRRSVLPIPWVENKLVNINQVIPADILERLANLVRFVSYHEAHCKVGHIRKEEILPPKVLAAPAAPIAPVRQRRKIQGPQRTKPKNIYRISQQEIKNYKVKNTRKRRP